MIVMTEAEIATVAKAHRELTFRPARRNRLICNQAPRLGPLTKKQAEALRNRVEAMLNPGPEQIPKSAPPTVQNKGKIIYEYTMSLMILCPHCYAQNLVPRREILSSCLTCCRTLYW